MIDLLQAEGSGASKNELVVGMPEGIVGGILGKGAGVIRLGTDVIGRGETIESEVFTLCAFEWVVALIADEGEAWAADSLSGRWGMG